MNKRLNQLLNTAEFSGKTCILDAYNQQVYEDISPTITTRVDASNMIFVMDYIKIKKPKKFENVKEVYQSHTLNEILPYLPNEDCFFDSRHWVCGLTMDILPFSVTTRISENNQQFLKTMIEKDNLVDEPPCYYEGTTKTLCLNSKVNGKQPSLEHRIYDSEGISTAITTGFHPNIKESASYRIRKLTPRECFRLMGVSESDIDKMQQAGISNSRQYQLAGNSIVVDTLVHIFRKLLVETGQESQQLSLF